MTTTKRAFGAEGEELAARFLKTKGMKLLVRNYTVKGGEIDLILLDKKTLVFCEVKTRTPKSKSLGSAQDAVHYYKRKHLTYAAKAFLARLGSQYKFDDCRFDVVEIYLPQDGTKQVFVRHTPYAFEPTN